MHVNNTGRNNDVFFSAKILFWFVDSEDLLSSMSVRSRDNLGMFTNADANFLSIGGNIQRELL